MDNGAAIPPDAIEWTYCIFHQKLRVYKFSTSPSQRDEIEHVVASYAMDMNPDLYKKLADGREGFLMEHTRFSEDLEHAVDTLPVFVTLPVQKKFLIDYQRLRSP